MRILFVGQVCPTDHTYQKFEDLLHKFFDTCRVNIDVYDNNGTKHTVREWFQAPYNQIVKAIDLLESGEIVIKRQ